MFSFLDTCAFYAISYYAFFWHDMCSSYDHNINLRPHYAFYAQPKFASPRDNTEVILTLPDSSFSLAQCKEHEVGEPFGFVSKVDVIDACFELMVHAVSVKRYF